jgi:3-phosphoshikimate 1-carboxyvinyltransferase
MKYQIIPGGVISGVIQVPADKSISHRAIMLASLSSGVCYITNFLQGEDSLHTLKAFQNMGVHIVKNKNEVQVNGVGLYGLKKPDKPLYLGNSGTAMRTLCGILCAQEFSCTLTGDESLNSRPMQRIITPLTKMGAVIKTDKDATAPLHIIGGQQLKPICYQTPVASAQIKTAIMLAALYTKGTTKIIEPAPSRNHSEIMFRKFKIAVQNDNNKISLAGINKPEPCNIHIPADISSAAFFIVAATISKNSHIIIKNIPQNSTRDGIIHILRLMGADIKITKNKNNTFENTADLEVKYAPLKGIRVPQKYIISAIDEFPIIFIAAACAQGTTTLSNAKELKVKESDRLEVMAEGLSKLGIQAVTCDDGITITGGQIKGGMIDSYGDHRVAMAFSMAGLVAKNTITITDCKNVTTSFPSFTETAKNAGLQINKI